MFDHRVIVITPTNKTLIKPLTWQDKLTNNMRQQIMEEEDRRIFEVLESLESGNNDI